MLMKEIIVRALLFAGREDIAKTLSEDSSSQGEAAEAVETLLYCANAAEDELSRYWFPLEYAEVIRSDTHKFKYSDLAFPPLKILSVEDEKGNALEYEVAPDGFTAKATSVRVRYTHSPKKKELTDASEYGDRLGADIPALGAAAEYCLINGEMQLSEALENRYLAAVERARRLPKPGGYVPPRRWV